MEITISGTQLFLGGGTVATLPNEGRPSPDKLTEKLSK